MTSFTHTVRPSRTQRCYKPFTANELISKRVGTEYLLLAQEYWRRNDHANAVACCLEGLAMTFGISRPLVVRDQLHDLLAVLDPEGSLTAEIQGKLGIVPTSDRPLTAAHAKHLGVALRS